MPTPYSISKYDPNWINMFYELKVKLSGIFVGKFSRIEHVGSTSIPGMNAKPLIDVLIIVDSINDLGNEVEKMKKDGYEFKTNYVGPNSIMFYKTEGLEKTENIHVCESNNDLVDHFIKMRDYLRAHPERAKEYSDLKLALKTKCPDSYEAYKDGKNALLQAIKKEAYGWSELRASSGCHNKFY